MLSIAKPSLSPSFSSQGSRMSASASLHSAFMRMAGFIYLFSVQPLLLLLIHRDSMRTLGVSKLSPRAFSHQSILRSTARFSSRGQNPSYMPRVRGRLPKAAGPSLNSLFGRGVKRRHDVWALVWSSEPWSPCCSSIIFYGARVGNSFPWTPLLGCQQGQVEILGAPLSQGAAGASLSHLVSVGTSKHWHIGSAHMLTAPTSLHGQVSELVAGSRQRLRCMAAAAVCACVRPHAVRTRPCSPHDSTPISHDARALTNLTCAYDSTRALAGG